MRLTLPAGDTALVSLHGAQVLSWTTADGVERLYLSPEAVFDGVSAIRGGVPLCFPQFNQRVLAGQTLPKHGFARTLPWALQAQTPTSVGHDGSVSATLVLTDSAATLAIWPHTFAAVLTATLAPGRLTIHFAVENTDTQPWPFALALHTYVQVADVTATSLLGLQGHSLWDAVEHGGQANVRSRQLDAALTFAGETDRVYSGVSSAVDVQHAGGCVALTQSTSLPELVVWNPAEALCSALGDMPKSGWRHMLCVEAACIDTPVLLAAGEHWAGWQQLNVMPPA